MRVQQVFDGSPVRRPAPAPSLVADRLAPARRPDIDGLRAVAVLLVVVYHVWFDRVSGGVDVFLLVSAYLLTESFLRRVDSGRSPALGVYWLRRAARLLPLAAVTILGVVVFTAIWMPESTWGAIWSQSWASLLGVENWKLAADSVDYYARTDGIPSPLLHFWSLSVQWQVFLLWPLVIAGGAFVARRTGVSVRGVLAVAFGAVFVLSFAYGQVAIAHDQAFAYFDTGARLWEFALGSLAALAAPYLRLGPVVARLLALGGLVGLVVCGMVFDVTAAFPGLPALWPTLCAIAVLWAGCAPRPSGTTRLLGGAALGALGRISYALYLVHWPVLIGFLVLTDSPRAGWRGGLIVIALSWVLAAVLHATIERPLLRLTARRALAGVAVASVALVALPLGGWQLAEEVRRASVSLETNPGALVLSDPTIEVPRGSALLPRGAFLADEWVGWGEGCGDDVPDDVRRDAMCVVSGSDDPDAPRVAVVGSSHAQQWSAAVVPTAEAEGWHLVGLFKGGCALTDDEAGPDDGTEHYADCMAWRDGVGRYLDDAAPTHVIAVGTVTAPDAPDERIAAGLDDFVATQTGRGSDVVLMRDHPRFGVDMFACVEQHRGDADLCDRSRAAVLAPSSPLAPYAGRDGVHVVDVIDQVCPDGMCPAVIGNVVVYLDDNHLTATYARSLAPAMQEALDGIRIFPPVTT